MFFLSVLFCAISQFSFTEGGKSIKFTDDTYKNLLAKAKAENKLVFVDIYTTWCAPCKWLEKNVFTDPEVGAFFNEHFINAHFDAMKGDGSYLADSYNVRSVPSLLFFDGNGKLITRAEGAIASNQLLDLAAKALDKAK